jgi:flavin-dependent dehydrogenase
MNKNSHLAIVGAGPAGAGAAIRLAQNGFRVTLIERERFPRHKLCGEFISPECLQHFRELGVFEEMLAAGGERIAETVFYAENGKCVGVPSKWLNKKESGALSLSRAEMDFRLLERAKSLGVEVLEEHSAIGFLQAKKEIRGVRLRAKDGGEKKIFADLVIDATGRARVLGKLVERNRGELKQQTRDDGRQTKLVGFKTHLKNVYLDKGVCEIYFFRGGYGGLSRVENDLANFCFLLRADVVREFSSDAEQIVKSLIRQNKRAAETLDKAQPVHDWLAVSVDSFGAKDLNPEKNLFAVGDAGAFIDPFTGSGMLMAFESAEILSEAIIENSASEAIAGKYEVEHARRFRRRLFVCSLVRRAAFAPAFAGVLISALSIGDAPRKFLAQATRPREAKL